MSMPTRHASVLLGAVAAGLLALSSIAAPDAAAHQHPASCVGNGTAVQVVKDKTYAAPGQTVSYAIIVSNQITGGAPCATTNVFVNVQMPGDTTSELTSICPGPTCANLSPTATTNGEAGGPACAAPGACGYDIAADTPLTVVGSFQYVADTADVAANEWQATARLNGGAVGTFAISHNGAENTQDVAAQDTVAVTALFPSLSISKECTTPTVTVGQYATFKITITNVSTGGGIVNFEDLNVQDTLTGSLSPSGLFNLAQGDSRELTFSHLTSQPGTISNVAFASGNASDPDGAPLGAFDSGGSNLASCTVAPDDNDACPYGWFGATVPPAPPWICDGVANEGFYVGVDATDSNDDNDLMCLDSEETASDVNLGGGRNALNPWDFADVPSPALPDPSAARDGAVALGDVASALLWFGAINDDVPNATGRDYDDDDNGNGVQDGVEYDRSPNGPISGPPDFAVSLVDAAVILNQFGDDCTAAPN